MIIYHPHYAVCLSCYDVFELSSESVTCPKVNCRGDLIGLDENMIPIIITLNKKGYKTLNCCSSHLWDNDMYIHFAAGEVLSTDNIPKGFHIEDDGVIIGGPVIRADLPHICDEPEDIDDYSKQAKRFIYLLRLQKWVDSLPDIT